MFTAYDSRRSTQGQLIGGTVKVQVASIENEVSQRMHGALGYEVVDRCVRFRKTL